MSIARQHVEWLSLVEPNGPFLSISVLQTVFPQGLEKTSVKRVQELRAVYEEWLQNCELPLFHNAWVEYVLRELLNLPDMAIASGQAIPSLFKCDVPEQSEVIHPDLLIHTPSKPHEARILLLIFPRGQGLNKVVAGRRWAASPAARMSELLRRCGIRLGLVTNGEQWLLINAQRDQPTGEIHWEADLWLQERVTLDAFVSLLGRHRTFNVPEDEMLEALLDRSVADQQEITDQLGYQVRKAVEILVQTLDRLDADCQRKLLCGISEGRVYEAALTVMMRLVFLLSAEQRGLLLLADPLYQQFYAVTTLAGQLRETANQQGEEVLERRMDAWCRLLATWRAVHGGIQHENLRLPAYGGTLFDPDRFAFLEGRNEGSHWRISEAQPLRIDNRTVLHLLEALQVLKVNIGGKIEKQRMSFRSLDVEQIGHVYEGLLDHEAQRANETMLGLRGAKNREPEVALSALTERLGNGPAIAPPDSLLHFLQEETGRSVNAVRNTLTVPLDLLRSEYLAIACGNDATLFDAVRPFAGLVRNDDYDRPAIFPPGSLFVTAGADRRNSGTHYTPRSLTEPIVKHTLEPLVFCGPAEGKAAEEWQLKSVRELLDLKVCDMAMGSGAFLVQVCRYLAERVVEAWNKADTKIKTKGSNSSEPNLTVWGEQAKGMVDEQLVPNDADERLALARRLVAERCLYGVDKNPLAVEMAKLSLWLITLDKNRSFTFLDHALKCGDSLLGVSLEQLSHWNLIPDQSPELFTISLRLNIEELISLRQKFRQMRTLDIHDEAIKRQLLSKADAMVHELKWSADMLLASYCNELPIAQQERLRRELLLHIRDHSDFDELWQPHIASLQENYLHWELEFPEVFVVDEKGTRGGFDAFISNPPFVGGQRIRSTKGARYLQYLKTRWNHARGSADYSAYFFLRSFEQLRTGGALGLIATNTIAQGDTRELGLEYIYKLEGTIYRAHNNYPWPGSAAVVVSIVHIRRGCYEGHVVLDGKNVNRISPQLDEAAKFSKPLTLFANTNKSFQGSNVLGLGFTMSPGEAQCLIDLDPRNKEVLFPYLNGEDLNSSPDQSPSRWVINFFDWPLRRGGKGCWHRASEKEQQEWLRTGIVPDNYPGSVAEDYPDCFAIVREKVYPERAKNRDKQRREIWWRFTRPTVELYASIAPLRRVLVVAQTSRTLAFSFVPKGWVYAMMTIVFAFEDEWHFGILQSIFHEVWARKFASTMKQDLRYTTTDIFENFPFPQSPHLPILQSLDIVGERYHETRRQIMLARQEGLTATYNRFHKPQENASDIVELRHLHVEMDNAVAAAYGWSDLELGHGFHETTQGVRYTIHEAARREVLSRLLALNHERYAEEVKAGLHEKKGKKRKLSDRKVMRQEELGQLMLL